VIITLGARIVLPARNAISATPLYSITLKAITVSYVLQEQIVKKNVIAVNTELTKVSVASATTAVTTAQDRGKTNA
jgi:hypothetical protein